uniref:Uncharacterized protein n=1 Tax=Quercus lobata TaxID=97700 RepID=A0A7N2MK63_QUELO
MGPTARGKNIVSNQLLLEGATVACSGPEETPVIGTPSGKQAVPDFEEILQDIDESINAFPGAPNSQLDVEKISEENEERMLLDVPVFVAVSTQLEGMSSMDRSGSEFQGKEVVGCEFQVGWASSNRDKGNGRAGSNKGADKKRGKCKLPHAKVVRAQESSSKGVGPTKKTWTRIQPRTNQNPCNVLVEVGPKRKKCEKPQAEEATLESVKKVRRDEGVLPENMIDQSLSAEAVVQPRRVQ